MGSVLFVFVSFCFQSTPCCSEWVISTIPSSNSLIYSSLIAILLSSPPTDFFLILAIIFSSSKILFDSPFYLLFLCRYFLSFICFTYGLSSPFHLYKLYFLQNFHLYCLWFFLCEALLSVCKKKNGAKNVYSTFLEVEVFYKWWFSFFHLLKYLLSTYFQWHKMTKIDIVSTHKFVRV